MSFDDLKKVAEEITAKEKANSEKLKNTREQIVKKQKEFRETFDELFKSLIRPTLEKIVQTLSATEGFAGTFTSSKVTYVGDKSVSIQIVHDMKKIHLDIVGSSFQQHVTFNFYFGPDDKVPVRQIVKPDSTIAATNDDINEDFITKKISEYIKSKF
jgi:hypothetical protein